MGRKICFSWKKDVTKLDIKDEFLRELVRIWVDFNYRDSFHSTQDFVNSMIWNNSLVRIANKTFFYKHWAKAGVLRATDS